MNKIWKGTIVSFFFMMICWFGFGMIDNSEVLRFITSIYSAILFVCFLVTGVVKQIRKKSSPYCIFAAVSFVIGIGISIYSFYDIKFDTDEWFKGLIGTVLLIFVIPFIVLVQIIDFIVWKKNKAISYDSKMEVS